jgi:hypothetical protein
MTVSKALASIRDRGVTACNLSLIASQHRGLGVRNSLRFYVLVLGTYLYKAY